MTQTIELNVNGARSVVTADPGTPLIYVLRNDLKLKGTRFGCGAGVCGCCTVLLDGRGIQSCNTPVSAAAGRGGHHDRRAGRQGGAASAAAGLRR